MITKEEIIELQKTLETDDCISKHFGLTRTAISYLRKKYGIPKRTSHYSAKGGKERSKKLSAKNESLFPVGSRRINRLHGSRYWVIKLAPHKWEFEHRLVMEKHINRKLSKQEFVHHIDGNQLNNSINNLLLTNLSDHNHIHKSKYPTIICQHCSKKRVDHFGTGICLKCYKERKKNNKPVPKMESR